MELLYFLRIYIIIYFHFIIGCAYQTPEKGTTKSCVTHLIVDHLNAYIFIWLFIDIVLFIYSALLWEYIILEILT